MASLGPQMARNGPQMVSLGPRAAWNGPQMASLRPQVVSRGRPQWARIGPPTAAILRP